MYQSLMIAPTAMTGGVATWATGGDFLQGAMQGMKIGLLNHAMHDDNIIRYYHDSHGNILGEISEVVVKPSGLIGYGALAAITEVNTMVNIVGSSAKKYGGNSSFGSNNRFYWHSTGQRGFYGNQYVRTTGLSQIGKGITKVTSPAGKVLDAVEIYRGYINDGSRIGYNTVRASTEVAGGWAGATAGLRLGGLIGGYIGGVPGAVIGGVVCGIGGAFCGSSFGTWSVDKIYGW